MVALEKRKYTKNLKPEPLKLLPCQILRLCCCQKSQTGQFGVLLGCYYSLRDLSCVKTKRRRWGHLSLSRPGPPHNQLWTSAVINRENFSPIISVCPQAAATAASVSRLILSLRLQKPSAHPAPAGALVGPLQRLYLQVSRRTTNLPHCGCVEFLDPQSESRSSLHLTRLLPAGPAGVSSRTLSSGRTCPTCCSMSSSSRQ